MNILTSDFYEIDGKEYPANGTIIYVVYVPSTKENILKNSFAGTDTITEASFSLN